MKKFLALFLASILLIMVIPFSVSADESNAAPNVIPAIRQWQGNKGQFIPNQSTVLVNSFSSPAVEKISGFFSDMLSMNLKVSDSSAGINEIVFTIDKTIFDAVGEEGYILTAAENIIIIKAPTDTGLLYGGITVVQSIYADGYFPCGIAVDYPEYEIRSGMLDVGRAYIPMEYLNEITRYMAFFKLNEIHVHINDDGENGYSAFRLESDIPGLTSKDGYYTKDAYRAYQKEMLEYGITVITEIDSPFHSRCYSNAENPPPYLEGLDRYLDITKPETLEFIKGVFAEYLSGEDPVFVNKIVHIGTDEYLREYAEEMRAYTNALIEYVNSFGYTPRFWAGFGADGFKGETPVSQKAQINFWDIGISGYNECLESEYPIINTINAVLYIVPTGNYGFPDYANLQALYENWQVNMFNYGGSVKMDPDDEQLLGACFALWNDLHTAYTGITQYDIFDRIRGLVCLMAEKTWNGLDTAQMSYEDFYSRYEKLSLRAGDSDPGRHSLTAEGITIDFESAELPDCAESFGGKIENGEFILDGEAYLSLNPSFVGFPNTLEFEITLDEATQAPIFYGEGVAIYADADGNGNFGFTSRITEDKTYVFTYGYQIPIGEKVKIRLSSDNNTTILTVNDSLCYEPINNLNPNNSKLSTLTIPLAEIGKGIKGRIDNIKIIPQSVDFKKLIANYNLALGADTQVSGLEVNDGRFTSDLAVDGDESTRLSFSAQKDEQWLILDLGDVYPVKQIEIAFFEHISAYEIYVSKDGIDYTKVYEITDGVEQIAQTDVITLETANQARYIKYVQLKRYKHPEYNTYYSGGITEFRVSAFVLDEYTALIEQAKSLPEDDLRKSEVISIAKDLESYLNQHNIYLANVQALYTSLETALQEPAVEESQVIIEGSAIPIVEEFSRTSKLPIIIGCVTSGIILAVIAVVIIIKKGKNNGN